MRVVDWPVVKEKAANVVANNPAIGGKFNDDIGAMLDEIKAGIGEDDFRGLLLDAIDFDGLELSSNGDDDAGGIDASTLAERFGVPPFSVLDARQGYWQDRKRAWLSLGIKSEIGRGGGQHGI